MIFALLIVKWQAKTAPQNLNLFHNFFGNFYLSFRNCPHFAHNYLLYLVYQMKLMAQT
jgi:hypothetical protein